MPPRRTIGKDWDRICRDLSSPESSDADDEGIDVRRVVKNAPLLAQLAQHVAHHASGGDASTAPRAAPPKGTNTVAPFLDAFVGSASPLPTPPPRRK